MNCRLFNKIAIPITGTPVSKADSGFSLLELIAAISVMGILFGIAMMNFQTWQQKNNIEAQTREILVDLNDARSNAFTQKKSFGIIFQANSYEMKSYSSAAAAAAPFTGGTTIKTKNLKYGLSKRTNTGTTLTSIADTKAVFDTSGITFDWFTIFVDPSNGAAAVNCIVISTARVNMGKANGTTCEFR